MPIAVGAAGLGPGVGAISHRNRACDHRGVAKDLLVEVFLTTGADGLGDLSVAGATSPELEAVNTALAESDGPDVLAVEEGAPAGGAATSAPG
jgi:hypothetical protein